MKKDPARSWRKIKRSKTEMEETATTTRTSFSWRAVHVHTLELECGHIQKRRGSYCPKTEVICKDCEVGNPVPEVEWSEPEERDGMPANPVARALIERDMKRAGERSPRGRKKRPRPKSTLRPRTCDVAVDFLRKAKKTAIGYGDLDLLVRIDDTVGGPKAARGPRGKRKRVLDALTRQPGVLVRDDRVINGSKVRRFYLPEFFAEE